MSVEFDVERFVERAAIMEFCGGMTRFQAEAAAAKLQGVPRWKAISEVNDANSKRDPAQARDHRSAAGRDSSNNVSAVQRRTEEKDRPMPKRDV